LETKTKRTAARPTNPVQNQNSEAPGNLEEPSSFRMKYFTPEVAVGVGEHFGECGRGNGREAYSWRMVLPL
jgi:hypothetical protein